VRERDAGRQSTVSLVPEKIIRTIRQRCEKFEVKKQTTVECHMVLHMVRVGSVLDYVAGLRLVCGHPRIRMMHRGAVSQAVPIEVLHHVRDVLVRMGVEVQVESDYKYRCVRAKRRRAPPTPSGIGLGLRGGGGGGDPNANTGLGLAAFTLIGSAASNGVDKRGLPLPSQPSTFGGATGGMLKGLLMRRQSSQVSGVGDPEASSPEITPSPILSPGGGQGELAPEPVYGDPSQDQGDEVRFYVELTKLDGLKDTYSIDIRRLKGHLRSYKFLYDYITQHLELQR
jgi:protein-serine/threonine kinase